MSVNKSIDKTAYVPFMEDGLTPRCQAAQPKTGGLQCEDEAVEGRRVCSNHGGKSTGPSPGSTNNLKHGLYSKIYKDLVKSPEDKERFDNLPTDPTQQAKENVKIVSFLIEDLMQQYIYHSVRKDTDEVLEFLQAINQTMATQDRLLNTLIKSNEKTPDSKEPLAIVVVPQKVLLEDFKDDEQ